MPPTNTQREKYIFLLVRSLTSYWTLELLLRFASASSSLPLWRPMINEVVVALLVAVIKDDVARNVTLPFFQQTATMGDV